MKAKLMAMTLVGTMLFSVAGCLNQATIAALVSTLGNAAASLAALEGDPNLATKLKADTAAATAAVLNWQKGTPAQIALEALNLVEQDLNLIPATGPYVPLIDLAIVTAESLITIITSNSPPVTAARLPHRVTSYTGKVPKNSAQFKQTWNGIVATNPVLASAAIK